MHVQAHTMLPGPIHEGNYMADSLARVTACSTEAASKSHYVYHQNVLVKLLRQLYVIVLPVSQPQSLFLWELTPEVCILVTYGRLILLTFPSLEDWPLFMCVWTHILMLSVLLSTLERLLRL